MLTETTKLKSGRTLQMNPADLEEAIELLELTAAELKQVGIELGKISLDMQLTDLDDKKVNTFKNVVCQLVGSKALKAAVLKCAGQCLLDGEAIRMETFAKAREDYLPVLQEVMVYNLRPFISGLDLSLLTARAGKAKAAAPA